MLLINSDQLQEMAATNLLALDKVIELSVEAVKNDDMEKETLIKSLKSLVDDTITSKCNEDDKERIYAMINKHLDTLQERS